MEVVLPFKVAVTCCILKTISQPALKSDTILSMQFIGGVYFVCVFFWVFPVFLSCKRSISYRCIELEALRSGAADKQTHQLEQKSEQISKSHKVVVKCLMLLFISQPALMSLDFCQCHNIHR